MAKPLRSIADIQQDRSNANRGTERGRAMLEHSLRTYGAGRSVLADKHGSLIAGNKTTEEWAALGLPIRTVETDGRELVVVQRTDLDLAIDPAARELAYADNRVGQIDLEWELEQLAADVDAGLDLSALFQPAELEALIIESAGVEVIGADVMPDEARTTNNMQLIGKGANVGFQCGDLMVVLPRDLYDRLWARCNEGRYPDRRAGVTDVLTAGLDATDA